MLKNNGIEGSYGQERTPSLPARRQRTGDASGVADVHGRRQSLSIRRYICREMFFFFHKTTRFLVFYLFIFNHQINFISLQRYVFIIFVRGNNQFLFKKRVRIPVQFSQQSYKSRRTHQLQKHPPKFNCSEKHTFRNASSFDIGELQHSRNLTICRHCLLSHESLPDSCLQQPHFPLKVQNVGCLKQHFMIFALSKLILAIYF